MKYFTLTEWQAFFKLEFYSNIELLLNRWHKIILIKWPKYRFIIQWPQDNKNSINFNSDEYTNYSKLLEDCYILLCKNKLITKSKSDSILITSTTSDFSLDSLDTSNDINSGAQGWFSFDSLLQSNEDKDISRDNMKWVEALSENDINEIILDDNLEKWFVKDWVMTLMMKQWSTYVRVYNKLTFIGLLVKYIEVLVENKKRQNTLVINNTISLYFQTKSQNLSIIEWEEWEWSFSAWWEIEWYTDSNLINSSFVLCSLSDLVIDKTNLKIWLNKVILNTETISKFYFN